MPVLEIRALPQQPPVDVSAVLAKVCSEVARAARIPEKQVWATWETLGPGAYAEGGDAPGSQPRDTHPPVVRVMAFERRASKVVETLLASAAEAVASALGLDRGNVFVVYERLKAGRVYSGGAVVK